MNPNWNTLMLPFLLVPLFYLFSFPTFCLLLQVVFFGLQLPEFITKNKAESDTGALNRTGQQSCCLRSDVAARSLFTWQRLSELRPPLLQLAQKFFQSRTLLHVLSHRSHCLCCRGNPLTLSGHGLDLLLQSASALCWVGVSSAVLQPLTGGDGSRHGHVSNLNLTVYMAR